MILVLDAVFSALLFFGHNFSGGPDWSNYLMAANQLFEPQQFGVTSNYFKPLYLLLFKLSQVLDPGGYTAIKIFQHALLFIAPLIVYQALKGVKVWLAFSVSLLMIFDMNTRVYASKFSTEALFIFIMAVLAVFAILTLTRLNPVAGSALLALALVPAVFTRAISGYLFMPILLFLFFWRKNKYPAVVFLATYMILYMLTQAAYVNAVQPTDHSKKLFLFQAAWYGGLVEESNGPNTQKLLKKITDSYYSRRLTKEETELFWTDLKAVRGYSLGVVYAVALERKVPEIDELFQKTFIEAARTHPLKLAWIGVYRMITAQKFNDMSEKSQLSGEEPKPPRQFDNAAAIKEAGIAAPPRARFRKNMWAPHFRYTLRPQDRLFYEDEPILGIVRLTNGISKMMALLINVGIVLTPFAFFFSLKELRKEPELVALTAFSALIIAYHSAIIIPVFAQDRYRAPVDVFYFMMMAVFYGLSLKAFLRDRPAFASKIMRLSDYISSKPGSRDLSGVS